MKKFLGSNAGIDRLGRTIIQGVLGVIVAYLDVFIGYLVIPDELRPVIVALVMAVLSPIMAYFGDDENEG